MSEGERYTSLLEELGNEREWALFHLIKIEGRLGLRINILDNCFIEAYSRRDDDRAKAYFNFLMKGVEDALLRPLAEEGHDGWPRGDGKEKCLVLPFSKRKEIDAAKEKTEKGKAALAMRLYPRLPLSEGTYIVEYIAQDETKMVPSRKATLLKTRAAILEIIAARWRNTKDEDEADVLFEFLWNLKTHWPEERDVRYAAMKNATDREFPISRIERHIGAHLDPRTVYREEKSIPALLAAAWMRSWDGVARVAVGARVTRALFGVSYAAFALTERMAACAREMDSEVVALASLLGYPSREWLDSSDFFRNIHQGFGIQYPGLGSVIVTTETHDSTDGLGSRGRLDEETLHDRFGKSKAIVEKWWGDNRENSQIRGLTLRFERYPRHDDKKPDFIREAHFGTHAEK